MYDGHIGIIIGIDRENEYVYVADTLIHGKGIWVTKFTYKGLVYSSFTHIIDFSEQFKEDRKLHWYVVNKKTSTIWTTYCGYFYYLNLFF